MPKDNLKDKLEGNELDLSLSNLSVVPVKELATIPRATNLDLSCNQLSIIPEDFCKLMHLVSIDLSKNQLKELPSNFGALRKLQRLDLFSNNLTSLPLSLCYMKQLTWLDLKDNPLLEPLKSIAGDCIDDVQCKQCAKKVVTFMKNVESEQQRQKQQKLKEQRAMEDAKKAIEEKEREMKKAEKRAEKDRRRKQFELGKGVETKQGDFNHGLINGSGKMQKKIAFGSLPKHAVKPKRKLGSLSCRGLFYVMLTSVIATALGIYMMCQMTATQDEFCELGTMLVEQVFMRAGQAVSFPANKMAEVAVRAGCLPGWNVSIQHTIVFDEPLFHSQETQRRL
ncbi:hypothetical protein LSAT2_022644 [Lamellibrachia satsuma]|nr:hypothetical protein LSAT2_022644 [Lamellibrachia satsuma]